MTGELRRLKERLSEIQQDLTIIMAGIADSNNSNFVIEETKINKLENEIDEMEKEISRRKEFVLYGENELSARLDLARAVARRAERCITRVKLFYEVNNKTTTYMNRLSDFFYILARFEDEKKAEKKLKKLVDN